MASAKNKKAKKAVTQIPPYGQKFIGWKKVYYWIVRENGAPKDLMSAVAKLEIPARASRMLPVQNQEDDNYGLAPSPPNRAMKCRASAAKVLEIKPSKGAKPPADGVYQSGHDGSFKYVVGKTVKPELPYSKLPVACESGIHFFLTRQRAQRWNG